MLEALPKILPGCDKDVAQVVERSFKKRGIEVRTGVKVTGHEPGDGGTVVNVEGADPIKTDVVVVSVGRKPATADLGLDGTGVQVDERGFVVVDERCRTGEDGVWAVGDCIATPAGPRRLRRGHGRHPRHPRRGPGADRLRQGALGHLLPARGRLRRPLEESAKEAGYDVVASKHRYSANSRAKIIGDQEGLVKVIAEKTPDGRAGTILGVHMVGPWVTEQLGPGLPGRQLGGHGRRGRRLHPAAPDAVRAVRRHGAGPDRSEAPLMADIQMPQLGETVTEGTITKWFKNVGDQVAEDEPLFEVSTDKVDSEVPSPVAGVLSEILVPEGDTVDVGVVLARVATPRPAAARRAGEAAPRRRRPSPAEAEAPAEPPRRPPRPRRRRPARPGRPSRPPPQPEPAPRQPAAGAPPPAGRPGAGPAPGAAPPAATAPPATAGCCRRSSAGSSPRTTSTPPPSPAPAPAAASPATTC